jgi:hypothetical protein
MNRFLIARVAQAKESAVKYHAHARRDNFLAYSEKMNGVSSQQEADVVSAAYYTTVVKLNARYEKHLEWIDRVAHAISRAQVSK